MKALDQKPIDLTTLGAVGELPPNGHAIYDHPNIESFRAPTRAELPQRMMQLEQRVNELNEQLQSVQRENVRALQLINQRLQMIGVKNG